MAWQDFYIQQTGSDLNAGSDLNNAPSVSEQTGTITAGSTGQTVFTAQTGTPFSGVSVGQWASLYNGGDTAAKFVGQVLSVGGSGASITISNDKQTGTALTCLGKGDTTTTSVSTAANGARCRVGGAWASLNVLLTGNAMALPYLATTGTSSLSLRVNIKTGGSSYTASGSQNPFFPTGAAAKPVFWRGYYTTPGDLDDCANVSGTMVAPPGQSAPPTGATRPVITASGNSIFAGGNSIWENLEFNATTISAVLNFSTGGIARIHRCRIISTNSGDALASSSTRLIVSGCYMQATSTGRPIYMSGLTINAYGNVLNGGIYGVYQGGSTSMSIINNIFSNCTTGIYVQTANAVLVNVANNTFYTNSTGTTGINIVSTYAEGLLIVNNIFSGYTTPVSINNTNTWMIAALYNDFHLFSTGLPAWWESFYHGQFTESSSPFVAAGSRDFTLASNAASRQAGFPGQFEV
jgi:hypothetical protein